MRTHPETTVTPLGRERRLFISDLLNDDDRTLFKGECERFDDGSSCPPPCRVMISWWGLSARLMMMMMMRLLSPRDAFRVKNFYFCSRRERKTMMFRTSTVCDGSIYNLYQKVVVVVVVVIVARVLLLLLLKRRIKVLLLLRMKVLPRRRMILPASRHHCGVPHVLRRRRLRGIPSSHASVLWRRRLLLLLL